MGMGYGKNDILTVTIEDIGNGGEGIGKVDGYTLFVKDAVIGDTVSCKITKAKKNYAYARLEKIIKPSEIRVEPICKYHRQCGGCQIQAMDYGAQLVFKQNKIRSHLIRIGGFDGAFVDRIMEPVVGMEDGSHSCFHYRNKAQFPVGTDKQGNPVTGFYAGRTHDIIANTDCALGTPENREILECILGYMREYYVPAYEEKTGRGLVRHILIRKGFTSGEIMVCLVLNGAGKKGFLPEQDILVGRLRKITGMTSVSVNLNTARTNVIMGKETHTVWGKDAIADTIHVVDTKDFKRTGRGITFLISPASFYQVNPVQTEKLYSLALEYAGLCGKETVWDIYCGIGTISLFMAGAAKHVYGVEEVPQAVADAKRNARNNGIENADFFVGKAEEVLPEKFEKEGIRADVIVVDPPRKGCDGAVLDTMLKMQPERIVYVSCDSATLARDLRVLCDGGYAVERIRGVDQFGHTVHVETVVKLSLKKDTPRIEVTMEPDAESNYTPAEKVTYGKIKEYVKEKYGLNVSSLYIAQIKDKCGLDKRDNYNLPKSEDAKVPICPPEKEAAIMDAFRHFGMI